MKFLFSTGNYFLTFLIKDNFGCKLMAWLRSLYLIIKYNVLFYGNFNTTNVLRGFKWLPGVVDVGVVVVSGLVESWDDVTITRTENAGLAYCGGREFLKILFFVWSKLLLWWWYVDILKSQYMVTKLSSGCLPKSCHLGYDIVFRPM